MVYDRKACATYWNLTNGGFRNTVDSRYLEFDGTMDKIRVNRSSSQEELRKYQECSLFNDERETTRAKFWRAETSNVPILGMILSLFDVFVAVLFLFYYNC